MVSIENKGKDVLWKNLAQFTREALIALEITN
jgi:hypothetical protein